MKTVIVILGVLLAGKAFSQGAIARADQYYAGLNYPMAIAGYERYITRIEPEKPDREVISKLANSYFFTNEYVKARPWYMKLYAMMGDGMEETMFLRTVTCLNAAGDHVRAQEMLKSYYSKNPLRLKMLAFQKQQLDSLKTSINQVKNLEINTPESDFCPVLFGSEVVFSSSRRMAETEGRTYEWNNQPYLNLFVATRNKNTGMLSNVKPFLDNLNTEFHDAAITFSPDQSTIYFTRNVLNKKQKLSTDGNGMSQIQIMKGTVDESRIVDSAPLEFNGKDFSCGHPAVSPDGKYLFFVSNMPGGYGETDLYVAELLADGTAGTPVNLGEKVNTAGREMFPYVSGDTLFFASDGHFGFGGLDIYYTRMAGPTNYSVPENMGQPLNSNADDFGLVLDRGTRSGYFSSGRKGGKGDDDIYWFDLIELPKFIDYSGDVLSENDGTIIPGALVQVYDVFNEKVLETSSDENGHYAVELPCNAQFRMVFSKEDYSTEAVNVSTPEQSGEDEDNDVLLASFKAIVEKEGDMEKIRVDPIYFEYNKWDITPSAVQELDKVIYAMEKFPGIRIRIESHTDARGSDSYNLKLSDNRAKSTMQYLIARGISADRIESAMGYGETRPKNRCVNGVRCSEEEHFENRRSDFIIISK